MENKKKRQEDYSKLAESSKIEIPIHSLEQASLTCPNCGSALESRKCKLLCVRPGCGYMVTCSEW